VNKLRGSACGRRRGADTTEPGEQVVRDATGSRGRASGRWAQEYSWAALPLSSSVWRSSASAGLAACVKIRVGLFVIISLSIQAANGADFRNRSAYWAAIVPGGWSEIPPFCSGRLVISLIEGLGLPGSAPPGSGSGSAARLHGGRVDQCSNGIVFLR
ncbi:unnamed protein product, partial [Nesidiocoris tenuis]